MRYSSVHAIGRYDCVFVSPHAGDAVHSCMGRLAWEVSRGMKVLVVTLFGDTGLADPVIERLGADEVALALPTASRRNERYARLSSVLDGAGPEDGALLETAGARLDGIAQAAKARHVYLPLAVGGHVDHRLAHVAGMSSVAEAPGREFFFYEDRPYSCLSGSVWVRLGQLGARLPPAVHVAASSSLVAFLLRFQMAAYVRGHSAGVSDRFASTMAAARQWSEARSWRPRNSRGPRFQPVDHVVEPPALELVHELLAEQPAPSCTARGGARSAKRARPPRPRTERYWLLLPSLAGERLAAPAEVAAFSGAMAGPLP